MGNRAVITTEEGWKNPVTNVGVYLHWNGGRDSVEAFLTYCKMKNYRVPERDNYGWAALVTVISNFFEDSGLSIGIDTVNNLDCNNYDNGVYIIKDWEIIARKYFNKHEQNNYDLLDMLIDIDNAMPTNAQLGIELIEEKLKELQKE